MLKLKSLESSTQQFSYDVFLSFSGEDTRKTFTDHLYTALLNEGLITFRDDEEIQRGESIKSELENGIRQSKSWIIVFSKNYAFSSWCLDELVLILECRNNSKRLLLPIFYHVDPSDVRKQSGSISEALYYHEEKFKREVDETKRKNLMDKIKRWRIALTQLANLGGMPLQNVANGYESKLIQKIVNVAKDKEACNTISMTRHPVGIGPSVQDISLWLRNGSSDVEMLALYGVGGIGKTTIAKYVYNKNFQLFEGGSFLEKIREYSERSNGLVCLQRQLLSDISKGKALKIKNLNDGILKIKRALHHKKLLIVLDDVDQVDQLDAIFGMREWFHQGSKIIITTRNVHFLEAYEHCTIYAIKTMNSDDSLELFSWHAFRDSHPPESHIEYTKRIIKQCQGLPLALKVVGSSLHGRMVDVWESAIKKLENATYFDIQKILRISYDSLQEDHDRDLFLDIACFFTGEAKSFVVRILDECDYYTINGIENLIDRCLLMIDCHENLCMHNLIKSMGREIIRLQNPKDPGQRSRLWHYKDSLKVLEEETGTREIEGLALEMNITNAHQAKLRTKAFSMMHKLRLLKLNNVQLSGGYKDFPKSLKWLCWHGFPFRSLPNDFPLSSVVELDMQSSKFQNFGQGNMLLGSLKFLNLSHCHEIVKTPDFAKLPALEQLLLEDCASLVEIDESIGMAKGLVSINLKDCNLLKKLPDSFCKLKLLEKLNISGCSSLVTFPAEMRKMESLKEFHADGLDFGNSNYTAHQNESWREFIWGLVSTPKISSQLSLTSLPCNSITNLSLVNCNLQDSSFPKDFIAPSLEYLNLSENPIRFFPDCFRGGLKEIKSLRLYNCSQLQTLEDLPKIGYLGAIACPLLEKIMLNPGLFGGYFVDHFPKLVEMERAFKIVPIGEIDSELINNCGIYDVESLKTIQITLYNDHTHVEIRCPIQGIYEYRYYHRNSSSRFRFSIFYRGSSVPKWFTSRSYGPSLSFIISHSKIRYLNICIVYKLIRYNLDPYRKDPDRSTRFYLIFHNMTKDKMTVYRPGLYGIPDGDEYMTKENYFKIVPIGEIDSELINNCGIYDVESLKTIQIRLYNDYTFVETRCPIQGIYEYQDSTRLNLFYPGSSVPIWFTSRSYMSSLSFIVSHSKLRYLNTCIVYKLNPDRRRRAFVLIFHNMTKDKMIIYDPSLYGIPEGDEYMTWLSHWKFGSHEVGLGDEINISILDKLDHNFEVKETGVHLVYEEQEQAAVHLAKRQKVQQTCEKISQYVIPVEQQPNAYHGTTQIYSINYGVIEQSWLKRYFGEYVPVETGEPSSTDSECN